MTGYVVHSAYGMGAVYLAAQDVEFAEPDNRIAWTTDVADAHAFQTYGEAREWAVARYRARWSMGLSEDEIQRQDKYVVLSPEELAALLLTRLP